MGLVCIGLGDLVGLEWVWLGWDGMGWDGMGLSEVSFDDMG